MGSKFSKSHRMEKKPELTTTGVETLRIGIRLTGRLLETIRETQELLGLHDEPATVRYLMTRGMEAMSEKLRAKRLFDRMQAQFSPQEVFGFMQEKGLLDDEKGALEGK